MTSKNNSTTTNHRTILARMLLTLGTLLCVASANAAEVPAQEEIDYFQLAQQQAGSNKLPAAIHSLNLVIARTPGHVEAYAMRALARDRTGSAQLADDDIRQAQALAPDSPMVLGARATIALDRMQYAAAEADAYRALQLGPDFHYAHLLYVSILERTDQHQKAVAHLEKMIAAQPELWGAYLHLANLHRNHGENDQAMAVVDRGLAIVPVTNLYLAKAHLRPAADNEGRERDFASAMAEADDPGMVLRIRTGAALEAGRFEEAIATSNVAIANSVIADEAPMLHAMRAAAYDRAGKPVQAQVDLAIARSAANNADQMNSVAWILVIRDAALPAALGFVRSALDKEPRAVAFLDTYGLVLLRLGRHAEAVQQYDALLAMQPGMADSRFARGIAKRRQGQTAAGDADLAAARAVNPTVDALYATYGITP